MKNYFKLFAFVIALVGATLWLGREPNSDLVFDRTVPITVSVHVIERALGEIPFWQRWFHGVGKVERIDMFERPMAGPEQTPEKGALIRFLVDPKKGPSRRFFILAEVTEYIPHQKIGLRLKDDRSGKLSRLFSQVNWNLEIIPAEGKRPALLHGSAVARTHTFRARFWGRLAERILMNQVYLPDLITLAEFALQPIEEAPPSAY